MSNYSPYKPKEPGTIWDAIANALDQVGGPEAAARHCRRKTWWAYTVADQDASEKARTKLSYDDACTMAQHGGTALVEHMALEAGGVFLPCASDLDGSVQDAIANASRETGEGISSAILAVATLGTCGLAKAKAGREIREGIRALTAMLAHVEGDEGSNVEAFRKSVA